MHILSSSFQKTVVPIATEPPVKQTEVSVKESVDVTPLAKQESESEPSAVASEGSSVELFWRLNMAMVDEM